MSCQGWNTIEDSSETDNSFDVSSFFNTFFQSVASFFKIA